MDEKRATPTPPKPTELGEHHFELVGGEEQFLFHHFYNIHTLSGLPIQLESEWGKWGPTTYYLEPQDVLELLKDGGQAEILVAAPEEGVIRQQYRTLKAEDLPNWQYFSKELLEANALRLLTGRAVLEASARKALQVISGRGKEEIGRIKRNDPARDEKTQQLRELMEIKQKVIPKGETPRAIRRIPRRMLDTVAHKVEDCFRFIDTWSGELLEAETLKKFLPAIRHQTTEAILKLFFTKILARLPESRLNSIMKTYAAERFWFFRTRNNQLKDWDISVQIDKDISQNEDELGFRVAQDMEVKGRLYTDNRQRVKKAWKQVNAGRKEKIPFEDRNKDPFLLAQALELAGVPDMTSLRTRDGRIVDLGENMHNILFINEGRYLFLPLKDWGWVNEATGDLTPQGRQNLTWIVNSAHKGIGDLPFKEIDEKTVSGYARGGAMGTIIIHSGEDDIYSAKLSRFASADSELPFTSSYHVANGVFKNWRANFSHYGQEAGPMYAQSVARVWQRFRQENEGNTDFAAGWRKTALPEERLKTVFREDGLPDEIFFDELVPQEELELQDLAKRALAQGLTDEFSQKYQPLLTTALNQECQAIGIKPESIERELLDSTMNYMLGPLVFDTFFENMALSSYIDKAVNNCIEPRQAFKRLNVGLFPRVLKIHDFLERKRGIFVRGVGDERVFEINQDNITKCIEDEELIDKGMVETLDTDFDEEVTNGKDGEATTSWMAGLTGALEGTLEGVADFLNKEFTQHVAGTSAQISSVQPDKIKTALSGSEAMELNRRLTMRTSSDRRYRHPVIALLKYLASKIPEETRVRRNIRYPIESEKRSEWMTKLPKDRFEGWLAEYKAHKAILLFELVRAFGRPEQLTQAAGYFRQLLEKIAQQNERLIIAKTSAGMVSI
jgi:hypothetical protein